MGVSAKFLAGLAVSAALVPAVVSEDVSAAPMTFKVTSASCTGPGSIVAAVEAANKNPGTDTIEFTPGLRVQADNYSCGSDHDKWIADVTESVTFEGNGARLVGAINWITPGGKVRPLSKCPDEHDSTDTMVALSPGFLSVGDGRSGPPGISVTVNNLRLDTLNSIADFVSDQGSLTMNNVRAKNILSHQFGCNTPAIGVRDASLTIRRSVWDLLVNWSGQPYPPVITGEAIQGWNTGDLTIEDSQFADVGRGGFINWTGAAGSTVDIVSTRMLQVGSITVFNGTTNIVNSVWVHSRDPSNLADMIINASPEPMNIVASTVLVSDARCGTACAQLDADGTVRQWEDDDGPVNLTQSAIGVPSDSSGTRSSVIANADVSASGGFSADADTWIQPLADQDAAALKTLTGQPALLTDPPGLVTGQFGFAPSFVSPLLGTTAAPGQLIDKIPDSACGGANELINPIDGKCIDEDVFGNSRWDTGNEARNIGAVQLTLAPHLAVDATGDGTVDLGWNRPVDGLGDKVKGYVVRSRPAGSSGPFTELAVTGPDSLWVQVKGLTNGTLYEFEVSAVRATAGAGPASNLATATPYGPVGAPVVTAQRQPGKITLFWTEPPSGGHSGPLYYTVVYRPVGEQTWLPGPGFLSGRTTFIPGLRTDTEYEFGVFATTFDRQVSGLLGTTTVAGVCRGKVATIMGTPGDDVLDGTAGPDVIVGGRGDDVVTAFDGDDIICLGAGDDEADSGDGDDIVDGGSGADVVKGGADDDLLLGNKHADTLHGGTGSDTVWGQNGDDVIKGGDGRDVLGGGKGDDQIRGGKQRDAIQGGAGADELFGNEHGDTIGGSSGPDTIRGGHGRDTIRGGGGNDQLYGNQSGDTIAGAAGRDTIGGGPGQDTISGGDNADTVRGGDHRDSISGGNGPDKLYGNDFADTIAGGNGNDYINGGAGYDTCNGGSGRDTIVGCITSISGTRTLTYI